MFQAPRQVKGSKPWPIHPWMVSFYDGKWRCQAGVIRDSDYTSGDNERTLLSYVQNTRQNLISSSRGGIRNEKGATNNPKAFALSEDCWTGGNKIYCRSSSSNEGIGAPTTLATSVEIPSDGCVKWASHAFSATGTTFIVLRKVSLNA